jgi:hypothetical protein
VLAQSPMVRMWNSLHLAVELTITAVGARRVGITALVLSVDALRRGRRAITMDAQR